MRLRVRHRTTYRYSAPIAYAIQSLRLQPSPYEGLTVLHWQVSADEGRRTLPSFTDGFGNTVHTHTTDRPHSVAVITAEGEVETRRDDGIVLGAAEPLPPVFYLRQTPLTAPDPAIVELAHRADAIVGIARLHALMLAVRDSMEYRIGSTDSQTNAAEALARGVGVCQDHAHLFIAAARAIGVPARYVGGYLWTGDDDAEYEASHAWAEAYVDDLGWIGFDPANRLCPTENYIRVGIGLDYWTAAPVRGIRRGVAEEALSVRVQVGLGGAEQ